VDEVDGEAVDGGRELLELIELALLRAPVKAFAPVVNKLTQVAQIGSVGPAVALQRLGNTRVGEARLQISQRRVGNADRERPHRVGLGRRPAGAGAEDGGEGDRTQATNGSVHMAHSIAGKPDGQLPAILRILLARSGSGKSVLLKLILELLRLDTGVVLVSGREAASVARPAKQRVL